MPEQPGMHGVSNLVDNAVVVSKCPTCGVQARITLGQFEAEPDLSCASCGASYFDDGIAQAANQIDDMLIDFAHKIHDFKASRRR